MDRPGIRGGLGPVAYLPPVRSMPTKRYTVVVDFDGVIHSYTSPWVNARTIPDPPVPGAIPWLLTMLRHFDVAILSTRNTQWFGKWAMRRWLERQMYEHFWPIANASLSNSFAHGDVDDQAWGMAADAVSQIKFPSHKPPALVYIDDRAWRFEGVFPTADQVHRARPWKVGQPIDPVAVALALGE